MGKKKYNTEDERKAAHAASMKRWYEKNKAERDAKNKQWYADNKEAKLAYAKQYRKQNPDYMKQWYADHRAERAAYEKQYYTDNKAELLEQQKQYYTTPFGRAVHLASGYRKLDKKYKRGECTIDAHWIVENVFGGQVCQYCGESDWHKLGCDRKDNSLPHTPENVRCCCDACNKKKWRKSDIDWLRKLWSECMLQPN